MVQRIIFILCFYSLNHFLFGQWKEISSFPNSGINKMIERDSVLYILTNNGLFATSDSGEFVYQLGVDKITHKVTCFEKKDSMMFVGTFGQGMFISSDTGKTWSSSNAGLNNLKVTSFSIDYYNTYKLGLYNGGTYYSSNNLWVKDKFENVWVSHIISLKSSSDNFLFGNYNVIKKVAYFDSSYVFNLPTPIKGITYNSVLNENDTVLYLGSSKGLYKAYPPTNYWYSMGFDNFIIQSIDKKEDVIVFVTSDMIYLSENNGDSWITINKPDDNEITACKIYKDYLFIGIKDGRVLRRNIGNLVASVGVYDRENNVFLTFPNPSYDGVININVSDGEVFNVIIRDISGEVVQTNHQSKVINLPSFLPKGVYFVTVESNKKTKTEKIILK